MMITLEGDYYLMHSGSVLVLHRCTNYYLNYCLASYILMPVWNLESLLKITTERNQTARSYIYNSVANYDSAELNCLTLCNTQLNLYLKCISNITIGVCNTRTAVGGCACLEGMVIDKLCYAFWQCLGPTRHGPLY